MSDPRDDFFDRDTLIQMMIDAAEDAYQVAEAYRLYEEEERSDQS